MAKFLIKKDLMFLNKKMLQMDATKLLIVELAIRILNYLDL